MRKENGKHISWDIHYGCGYRCSYCFLRESSRPELAVKAASPGEWLAAWERFHRRWGKARVDISGGEPFLYPGFPELLSRVSRMNEVWVITGFGWDPASLPPGLSTENVHFVLSFHPEHAGGAADFISRAAQLRDRGFRARVTAVAYPPFMREALECGRLCADAGLRFTLTPFFGDLDGRSYPASYTEAELRELRGYIRAGLADWQLGQVNPKGRPCRAGADYARVSPDGTARPCLHSPPMGNFLSPDFDFNPGPSPCPSDYCHCMLESAYCAPL